MDVLLDKNMAPQESGNSSSKLAILALGFKDASISSYIAENRDLVFLDSFCTIDGPAVLMINVSP